MLVVLDRDGVINEDSDDYIKSPKEWRALAGSLEAIAKLKQAGHQVVVATNQSGVGRGLYTQTTLNAIHDKMHQALAEHGVTLDGVYFCPHHPDDGCGCRKPEAGLFLQIEQDFQPRWINSVTVGDSLRDIQAAQAIGCPAVLVKTGKGQRTLAEGQGLDAVPVFDDLAHWVRTACPS